jgi:hypothetical protein
MSLQRIKWRADELSRSIETELAGHKCLTCAKHETEVGELYRCWDCKMLLCEGCVKHHFGTQHQPHPRTRTQLRNALGNLLDAYKAKCGRELKDDEALLVFRAEEVLQNLPPEKGDDARYSFERIR